MFLHTHSLFLYRGKYSAMDLWFENRYGRELWELTTQLLLLEWTCGATFVDTLVNNVALTTSLNVGPSKDMTLQGIVELVVADGSWPLLFEQIAGSSAPPPHNLLMQYATGEILFAKSCSDMNSLISQNDDIITIISSVISLSGVEIIGIVLRCDDKYHIIECLDLSGRSVSCLFFRHY